MAYDGAVLPFDPVRRLATAVVRTPGRLGRHTLVVKGDIEAVTRALYPGRGRARTAAGSRRPAGATTGCVFWRSPPPNGPPAAAPTPRPTSAVSPSSAWSPCGTPSRRPPPTPWRSSRAGASPSRSSPATTRARPPAPAGTSGLDPADAVLCADTIEGVTDAELADLARRTTVFARCTPEHKARIISALRAAGHTTGFLGDGVNDLPALRAADVGICPRDAVDVARESADVVLAEKDLTAIAHAISSGRHSSGNIATYLRITLSSNLGNVIAMLADGPDAAVPADAAGAGTRPEPVLRRGPARLRLRPAPPRPPCAGRPCCAPCICCASSPASGCSTPSPTSPPSACSRSPCTMPAASGTTAGR